MDGEFVEAVSKSVEEDSCSISHKKEQQQSSKCCEKHKNQMLLAYPDSSIIKCTTCRCYVNEMNVKKYDELITKAKLLDNENIDKLKTLLDAFEIIDDDPNIHMNILLLGEKFGCVD